MKNKSELDNCLVSNRIAELDLEPVVMRPGTTTSLVDCILVCINDILRYMPDGDKLQYWEQIHQGIQEYDIMLPASVWKNLLDDPVIGSHLRETVPGIEERIFVWVPQRKSTVVADKDDPFDAAKEVL